MTKPANFDIGICASDSARALPSLLGFLRAENFGSSFALRRITVVASGCPQNLLAELEAQARDDNRISVITEPERRGKSEAVNRIIAHSSGEYLALLNGDARPARGAILTLLEELSLDERAGCVSAHPLFTDSEGLLGNVLRIMWSAHNLASLKLNHSRISNHSSDELLVARRELLRPLPRNLVNDGAYIAGRLKAEGYMVKFSPRAKVVISVPTRPTDLVNQRRRIIYGHVQVWRKLGKPPRTVESLLFISPLVGMRIFVSTLAASPRLILSLPAALVSELFSAVLAFSDTLRSTDQHSVWKRFES